MTFNAGVAEPVSPSKLVATVDPCEMVTVLPEPEVSIPVPPRISRSFPNGTAEPESVVKLVGI